MDVKKTLRVLTLFVLFAAGIWLLGRPGRLQPEGVARLRALNSLTTQGAPNGPVAQGDVATGQTIVHDPVSPAVVAFDDVVISSEDPDSMFNRWMRGEVDLDENDGIVSEAEMARMIEEALAQPVDDDVQIASSLDALEPGLQPRAPIPGLSFDAIDYTWSGGSVPPDPELAVGPDHMIAVVNVSLAIYNKSGATLVDPTFAGNFFSALPNCRNELYDPNVLYDEEADRWILAYDKGAFDSSGGHCLAASQSGDPTGAWYLYFFALNSGSVWLDFPHAGVGDNYIFMGGNMFTYTGAFFEGRVFAFDKSDLYNGNPVSAVQRGLGSSSSTPQPLKLHGVGSGTWPSYGNNHYFLTDPYDGQTYNLLRWNPVSNSLTPVGNPNLGPANQPLDVPQNGAGLMQANDWRPLDFEYRNGYGWTTMSVSCNPGGGSVNCIRWAQIDLDDGSIGPAGVGTYGSTGQYRFFPDLAVNHCNDMAVGYTRSSSSSYPSIWVTGRQNSDPNGLLQVEAQLKAGEIAYTAFDNSPRRWGDYTGMTIDPDGETFWYLGQYSKDTGTVNGRWGTYVGSFRFADCGADPPDLGWRTYLPIITKPAPTPPPVSGPDPGYWLGGNTEAPDYMEFYVTPDRASVEQFTIHINVPGCGNYRIWRTIPSTISNDAFSFSGSYYASGSFSSRTQAGGTVGLDEFFINNCGLVSGSSSWQASWANASQPTFTAGVTTPYSITVVERRGIDVRRVDR